MAADKSTTGGPLCSVVCITYNHARFAEAALNSIFAQTYRDVEIVVIDDGSTDNTAAVVERALEASPFPSRLLTQKNTGKVPLNLNRALAVASGDLVAFLSLDDMFHPTALAARIAPMKEDDGIAFAADLKFDEIDDGGRTIGLGLSTPIDLERPSSAQDLLECEFRNLHSFHIQSGVFRRSVVDAVGGFDEDMIGDDIILRTKVFRHIDQTPGLTFRLIDNAGFRYRKHANNLHLNSERQIRTIVQWRDRYFPGRPLSDEGVSWIRGVVQNALIERNTEAIAALAQIAPEVEMMASQTRMTWKMHRKRLKRRLVRAFGRRA